MNSSTPDEILASVLREIEQQNWKRQILATMSGANAAGIATVAIMISSYKDTAAAEQLLIPSAWLFSMGVTVGVIVLVFWYRALGPGLGQLQRNFEEYKEAHQNLTHTGEVDDAVLALQKRGRLFDRIEETKPLLRFNRAATISAYAAALLFLLGIFVPLIAISEGPAVRLWAKLLSAR